MINEEIEILKGLISFIKVENGKFSDTDIKFLKGINSIVNELSVENERWITIHPHGNAEDENGKKDYRRLLLEDGETPEEAIKRVYKKEDKKQEKTVEELKAEKKQLYQDVLKAKKEGNRELQRKLFDRYNEIDRILKGEEKQKPTAQKEQKNTSSTSRPKHFEKYDKIKEEADKLQDIWNKKSEEYRTKLEQNNEFKNLYDRWFWKSKLNSVIGLYTVFRKKENNKKI